MIRSLKRFGRGSDAASAALVAGVDMGLRRIKVAALSAGPERPRLVWSLDVPAPAGIVGSDGSFDSVAAGRVLAQLLAGSPLAPGAPGAMLLPSAVVRVRRFQPGTQDPAALSRLLAEDSELRIPGTPADALHRTYTAIGDTPGLTGGDAVGTLVAAAARRDAVRAYAAAAAAAGVGPRLAAPAVALSNLHALLHPEETQGTVVLLHVGSARTELVVVHRGAPVLVLPVVVGTDALLERVRGVLPGRTDPEQALRGSAGAAAGEVREIVDEWVSRLQGAHRTAIGAAEQRLRTRLETLPVRISGGAALLPLVVERLAGAVPDPVSLLDPGTAFSGEGATPALALALGAALEARGGGGAGERSGAAVPVLLDLSLPREAPARTPVRHVVAAAGRDGRIWVALAAAGLAGAGIPALLSAHVGGAEAALASAREGYRREATRVAADSARVAALEADSARLAGTLGTLARLDAQRYAWPRLMDGAAGALPRYAWIEELVLDSAAAGGPARFTVRGVAPAQADVSRFERALGASPGASAVALEESRSLQSGPFPLVGFTLGGEFGPGSPSDRSRPGGAGYHPGETTAPVPGSVP